MQKNKAKKIFLAGFLHSNFTQYCYFSAYDTCFLTFIHDKDGVGIINSFSLKIELILVLFGFNIS